MEGAFADSGPLQVSIIIIFCRALNWPLSKMRQPRVISEVIGGILLGPSVMGRIPGFTANIFPEAAMPQLSLVANLGLILFLFIIGLEVDLRFLISNWKVAANVGLVSMAVPFGLGCAIAVGLYNQFKDEPETVAIDFPVFMLFIGVAMAITVSLIDITGLCASNSPISGLSRALPHFDRTEAAHDARGHYRAVCRRCQRRCW